METADINYNLDSVSVEDYQALAEALKSAKSDIQKLEGQLDCFTQAYDVLHDELEKLRDKAENLRKAAGLDKLDESAIRSIECISSANNYYEVVIQDRDAMYRCYGRKEQDVFDYDPDLHIPQEIVDRAATSTNTIKFIIRDKQDKFEVEGHAFTTKRR